METALKMALKTACDRDLFTTFPLTVLSAAPFSPLCPLCAPSDHTLTPSDHSSDVPVAAACLPTCALCALMRSRRRRAFLARASRGVWKHHGASRYGQLA